MSFRLLQESVVCFLPGEHAQRLPSAASIEQYVDEEREYPVVAGL